MAGGAAWEGRLNHIITGGAGGGTTGESGPITPMTNYGTGHGTTINSPTGGTQTAGGIGGTASFNNNWATKAVFNGMNADGYRGGESDYGGGGRCRILRWRRPEFMRILQLRMVHTTATGILAARVVLHMLVKILPV